MKTAYNKPSLHIYNTCFKIISVQVRFKNFLPKSLHIHVQYNTETKKFNNKWKILNFVILEVSSRPTLISEQIIRYNLVWDSLRISIREAYYKSTMRKLSQTRLYQF
jgi:hypothetical protein